MVDKYIKDGKTAILVSPGFGAGWSTWGEKEMAYDADLVKAFIDGGTVKLEAVAKTKYPNAYLGGAMAVKIEWLACGTKYRIEEYDGSESIRVFDESDYNEA